MGDQRLIPSRGLDSTQRRVAVLTLIWGMLLCAVVASPARKHLAGATHGVLAARMTVRAPRVATKRVPDVAGQAYVFAKVALEEAGFAWQVSGKVGGFAGNIVVRQDPRPGARVVARGAPLVRLWLARSRGYAEVGLPDNSSPYAGTRAEAARR